jgi:predicted Zn-ribbon and HTH transcriptional regulator
MKNHCLKCGYEWEGRVKEPRACPYCKSMKWALPKREVKKINPKIREEGKE